MGHRHVLHEAIDDGQANSRGKNAQLGVVQGVTVLGESCKREIVGSTLRRRHGNRRSVDHLDQEHPCLVIGEPDQDGFLGAGDHVQADSARGGLAHGEPHFFQALLVEPRTATEGHGNQPGRTHVRRYGSEGELYGGHQASAGRADRLGDGGVDREHLAQPGDLEDLQDTFLGQHEDERAVLSAHPVEGTHKDAQAGGVEELNAGQVEHQVDLSLGNQLDDPLTQLRRGIDVDLAANLDDRAVALCSGHQGEVHGVPFSVRGSGLLSPIQPSPCDHARDVSTPSPADGDLAGQLLAGLTASPTRAARVTHVEHVAARPASWAEWPTWVDPDVIQALGARGAQQPYTHQVEAAEHAHAGRSVVVSTGTASGKSLAYLLPALTAVREGAQAPDGRASTVLYLSPTKALAADQLRALTELAVPDVRPATVDGDTPREERDWARAHASYVLTNPDMLHHSLLPGHARWAPFWRSLSFVVVDECHAYRGVFGSHVAAVLRRLQRIARRYGAEPVFVLASATVSQPDVSAQRLIGQPVVAVTRDGSPRGSTAFALWEPPLTELIGERGAPIRRSVHAETADLLTDLVIEGARTLAFVRSRRGAEVVAMMTKEAVAEIDPSLADRVAAYRAGYLPEERRAVEADLQSGRLLAVAATSALELGVDVAGLDAVLLAGWPGTLASMWQQAGRAGRAGQGALAVLIARDDPLDTYLVHHPEAVFGRPVEATVLDPSNPYILGPHLCAAAAELPLTTEDLEAFGPGSHEVVADLVERELLRARPGGWYWTRPERASDLADLRGTGGGPVRVVESTTGRVVGTVDRGAADRSVHAGAVYVHQGSTYLVDTLDLDDSVALVTAATPDWTTSAREVTDLRVIAERRSQDWGAARLCVGDVEVTTQVVAFMRRRLGSGEVLGEEPLDLPARTLRTVSVWWSVAEAQLVEAELGDVEVPGSVHAAEHAAIGLLPLVATCDRWDIGGVSTAIHPDTDRASVFVFDGHAGGAGFAERGFERAAEWLAATLSVLETCECPTGCPSCVQSPKCGNGNDPLNKAGATRLLRVLLAGRPVPEP